jgi:hypothetical protein
MAIEDPGLTAIIVRRTRAATWHRHRSEQSVQAAIHSACLGWIANHITPHSVLWWRSEPTW